MFGMIVQLSLANLECASPTFPFFEKEVQQAKSFVESSKTIPLLCRRRLLAELEHKQKLGVRPPASCQLSVGVAGSRCIYPDTKWVL